MGNVPQVSPDTLAGIIGAIIGSIIGVIVGFLLNEFKGLLGHISVNASEISVRFGTGELSDTGCYSGSSIDFVLTCINKKSKPLIMHDIELIFYKNNVVIGRKKCADTATARSGAGRRLIDTKYTIDVPGKASISVKLENGWASPEVPSCTRIVFMYKWGWLIKRRLLIWDKK